MRSQGCCSYMTYSGFQATHVSNCFGMSYALERSSCQNNLEGESSEADIQRVNGPEIHKYGM